MRTPAVPPDAPLNMRVQSLRKAPGRPPLYTPLRTHLARLIAFGGALAIGVADRVLMLQYGMYSVISPEGCASILWHSAEKAAEAAEIMQVTSGKLEKLGLIDGIIAEPLGGAHRNKSAMAETLRTTLTTELAALEKLDSATRMQKRMDKIRAYGQFATA